MHTYDYQTFFAYVRKFVLATCFAVFFFAAPMLSAHAATILATAGPGGSISPAGTVPVTDGEDQEFTITPDAGFEIETLTVNGAPVTPSPTYLFEDVFGTEGTIHATFAAIPTTTYTINASSEAGGSIDPLGEVVVDEGDDVEFVIVPDSGFEIAALLIDGVTTTATTTYLFENVVENHTIHAVFSAVVPTYTITASAGAGGTIDPLGAVVVSESDDQLFTITPDLGFSIDTLLIDGVSTTTSGTYLFEDVMQDHTIDVTFVMDTPSYSIVTTAGENGMISPFGTTTVLMGDDLTVTITPNGGFVIDTLLVDGVPTLATTTIVFENIVADHTVDVTFEATGPTTYDIIATAGPNGSIAPSSTTTVVAGADQTFTITPDLGYMIDVLSIDGATTTATTTVTFEDVADDHTIDVTFTTAPTTTYTITATVGNHGTMTPSGVVVVEEGASQLFTITPNAGYEVDTITIDGATTTPTTTILFENVTADHVLDVTFRTITPHVIVATAGPGGSISPLGTTTVMGGESQTYTITPNAGFAIDTLVVDSIEVTATTSYTFAMVMIDHSISVTFVPTYELVGSAGPNGSISPLGTTTVREGDSLTFVFTPDLGFSIDTVFVDGVPTTTNGSYTFVDVAAHHTIAVTFEPGYTIIASAGPGGEIDPEGSLSVNQGDDITFTITPDSGFAIDVLLVDGVATTSVSSYTFSDVQSGHMIDVTFIATYEVVAAAGPNGSITPAGTTVVTEGSDLTLTVTPNAGYAIDTIFVDGVATTSTTIVFEGIAEDHLVTATFREAHMVTAIAGANGSISPSGSIVVHEGDDLELTIAPDAGYTIDTLIVDSVLTAPTTTILFENVTGDHTVSVTFIPIYTIVASVSGSGSISPSGTTVVIEGEDQTFTITPDSGFGIQTLIIDGATTTATTSYTFANVADDHTIEAVFVPVFPVTTTAGANGSVDPLGTILVNEGDDVTVTITPDFGFGIDALLVDGVTTTPTTTVVFTDVDEAHSVDVTFRALILYEIVATAGENGTISPSGTTTAPEGTNQTFTITPAFGYGVETLLVDGATQTPALSYTFTNVQENHTVAVTFVRLPTHIIQATAGENGSISPSGTTTVIEGTNQVFFMSPAFGYRTASILVDGDPVALDETYAFVNVQSAHTIHVEFEELPIHTITASATGNGSITPNGATLVYETYDQTYTFTPGVGFTVGTVLIDGSSIPVPSTNTYTFENIQGDHTIEVTFVALPTHTITATAGVNGSISPNGAVTVFETYDQIFTITPDIGFGVGTLMIDGELVSPASSYTFENVTMDHTIEVTFVALPTNTITASAGVGGSISPAGAVSVFETYNQTFTITPDAGFAIDTLLVDGVPVTASSTYTFVSVTDDHTISVTFVALPSYTITASAGAGGSISPSGAVSVFEGYDQLFTITPDLGFGIDTVTIDGVATGTVSSYLFEDVTQDHTISVTFVALPSYTITAGAGANGSISPSGSVTVYEGDDQTFTITPDSGFVINQLIVNGVPVTASTTYTFENVTGDQSIAVTFVAITGHTIAASAGRGGSISPEGSVVVATGGDQTFTITPDNRYRIRSVFVDGVRVSTDTSYTFSGVTSDHTIEVTFESLSTSGGGGGGRGGSGRGGDGGGSGPGGGGSQGTTTAPLPIVPTVFGPGLTNIPPEYIPDWYKEQNPELVSNTVITPINPGTPTVFGPGIQNVPWEFVPLWYKQELALRGSAPTPVSLPTLPQEDAVFEIQELPGKETLGNDAFLELVRERGLVDGTTAEAQRSLLSETGFFFLGVFLILLILILVSVLKNRQKHTDTQSE